MSRYDHNNSRWQQWNWFYPQKKAEIRRVVWNMFGKRLLLVLLFNYFEIWLKNEPSCCFVDFIIYIAVCLTHAEWRSKSLVFAKLVKNKRTIVACTSRIRRKPVFSEISLTIRPDPVGAFLLNKRPQWELSLLEESCFGAVEMSWVSDHTVPEPTGTPVVFWARSA